jgi:hypothetical protein
MFQKKIWISAVLLCTLCTWSLFGTIPTAHADAIDDAYSAGKLFGSGSTVLVWGILGTIGAIREMAEDEGINSSNGITLGFGLGQLALGGTLLGLGLANSPDSNKDSVNDAFSAGSDVGVGISFITYGSLLSVGTILTLLNFLDYPDQTDGWDWLGFSALAALSAFQIGYGVYLLNNGRDTFDTIRAQNPTNTQALTLPVMSFTF